MPIERVGHVAIKMRDLDAAKRFYGDILGMKIIAEVKGVGVFFGFQEWPDDIAVVKVGDDAESPQPNQVGLAHIALRTDSFATVKAMYQRLKEHNVTIVRAVDHGVTKSVYCLDPEGNQIEIFCAVPEVDWRALVKKLEEAKTLEEVMKLNVPLDFEAVSAD
jgi:catechol 2,3-dioxygenase